MSIRINTTPNGSDKYLKVNLEQEFDFIEILSLKISQEDAYRKFCSDYGVIVGRVTINNGFGVPNAKVSVFIPLDEIDKYNPEIKGLYPYEVITDKNEDGVRYNLLPKDSAPDNDCFTPIGNFPTKREVLDNTTMLDVYCKYYKFTTTTNHAGDFMIFGVPLGTHTVHLDADISDMGILSQRPYDLTNQGTPLKAFDSPTKFKGGKNLDNLVQIKTVNVGVNVEPFWGDKDNCVVGITRLDIPLNYIVIPSAIFMGSTFGDSDKNSISKKCKPRKNMGNLCDQVTSEGSISMIRKTIDGNIEKFDVEGGRVIDENGAWAYQIPMNLDYITTNENGDLIASNDPNIGVPTRSSVRFKISMDETGGQGRLRTRAKHLVPHNPSNLSEIDYRFGPASNTGPATKNTSFKDLYWNKIYSVRNYIPRFQTNFFLGIGSMVDTKSFTGIKEVDFCGDKTPFPYNRVDTDINPIFFIICIIMEILATVIWLVNLIIIPIINFIIKIIRTIISVICSIISTINSIPYVSFDTPDFCDDPIDYVQCLSVECEGGSGKLFAPGCSSGTEGFDAFPQAPLHYADCNHNHGGSLTSIDRGLIDCIAFQLAIALDMLKFHFYNEWINGTLYSYLLKYKKKRKKSGSPAKENFCEYECKQGSFTPIDGTDDNKCRGNHLLDTCVNTGSGDMQKSYHTYNMSDGLIKEVDGEHFYAATTHNLQQKLFATDIISLGSVFNCDWQSEPKINDLLVNTTYKVPPYTDETDDTGSFLEESGMVSLGGANDGLFFSINCLGLHVDGRQCINIKRICEFGVDTDQSTINTSGTEIRADYIIGVDDIDNDYGIYFRDAFYGLNGISGGWPSTGFDPNWNTNFNLINNPTTYLSNNGGTYDLFTGKNGTIPNTKNSYYFYFGIVPGNSGLELMNRNYFTPCERLLKDSMIIESNSVASTQTPCNGSITFSFIGGTGNISWTVTGPSFTQSGIIGPNINYTIPNLCEGQYTIEGTDSVGTLITQTVSVGGIDPLVAWASVTHHCETSISTDGEITISDIYGGTPPYTYQLFDAIGNIIVGTTTSTPPTIISNLLVQYNPTGYTLTITDSAVPTPNTYSINNLVINGPLVMIPQTTKVDISCFGSNNGQISTSIVGGTAPFTLLTTNPNGYSSTSANVTMLSANTYTTTVTDNSSPQQVSTTTTIITELSPKMTITKAAPSVLLKQCDPNNHILTFTLLYAWGAPAIGSPAALELEIAGVTIPASVIFTGNGATHTMSIPGPIPPGSSVDIKMLYTNINGVVCESPKIQILSFEIALPPAWLAVTRTTPWVKQCTPSNINFGVNINNAIRAPFKIDYTINGVAQAQITGVNGPSYTWNITPLSPTSGTKNIVIWVTDVVGCVTLTTLNYSENIPSVALWCNINTIAHPIISGSYIHTVTAGGGIAPLTFTGYATGTHTNTSPVISTIVTDNNGCTVTAVG